MVWTISGRQFIGNNNYNFQFNVELPDNQTKTFKSSERIMGSADVYRFYNDDKGAGIGGIYYIFPTHLYHLEKVTTRKEYDRMDKLRSYSEYDKEKDEWIYWKGSCHGMALTSILFHTGRLTPSYWYSGEKSEVAVNDLPNDSHVISLINYYHVMQKTDVQEKVTERIVKNSDKENLSLVKSLAENENTLVSISFSYTEKNDKIIFNKNHVAHSVVLYGGIEDNDGSWGEINNMTYQHRIKTYDNSRYAGTETYLYFTSDLEHFDFNTWTDKSNVISKKIQFIVPDYEIDTLDPHNPEQANLGGKNFIASNEQDNQEKSLLLEFYNSTDFQITMNNGKSVTVDGLIAEGDFDAYPYVDIGTVDGEGAKGVNVFIPQNGSYTVTKLNNNPEISVSMSYENSLSHAISSNGNSAIFSENAVSMDLNGGDYTLRQVCNDGFTDLSWHTVTVSGENANTVSMNTVDDGILLLGDNLENVVISGENDKETVELKFSTEQNEVLIKQVEETLNAYVDIKGDGDFDVLIAKSEVSSVAFILGRIISIEQETSIFDALEILKALVGMSSLATNNPAALITAESKLSGTPTIFDALEILKKLVGMENKIDS